MATPRDSEEICRLLERWQPLIAIVAFSPALTRPQRDKLLRAQTLPAKRGYYRLRLRLKHTEVGGVSTAVRNFVHFSRLGGPFTKEAAMMVPQYSHTLQTALDDTIGWPAKQVVFEDPVPGQPLPANAVGFAIEGRRGPRHPVFDGKGRAPDIGALPENARHIWVRCFSARGRGKPVVRPASYDELLSIWDYEGKMESKHWGRDTRSVVLTRRLHSPPPT